MSKKTKAIIAAVLALLVAGFGAYSAYSDKDPNTKPDTKAVVESARSVYEAVTLDGEEGDAVSTVVE